MVTHLSCWLCGREFSPNRSQTICPDCERPLKVHYELGRAIMPKEILRDRAPDMWRYREVLPGCKPVTLGEGFTPLHSAHQLGPHWLVKDESMNPTGSFKARGMSAAISVAWHFGYDRVATPSAGNAASAMAAYAAAAGQEAFVFMPSDTPRPIIEECRALGAKVELVDGLITDCGKIVRERTQKMQWFDLSTLREPYRIEGKKTMGYELVEQMDFRVPDAIVYPTGGGTGLIGMWKAFDEMEQLGWIDSKRPKMISVQAKGCAPIVRAFDRGDRFADEFENPYTYASGLRVPKAIGDFIMLDLIRESKGTAVTVTDQEMAHGVEALGSTTGIYAAPEGGAVVAAAEKLTESGFLDHFETVVLFCTGSGLKYAGSTPMEPTD